MSFTHRLFHLVWSCSQNGFLKLSYRTLEAKSWCSFSKYNDYALFQSNCSMCYMSKKKKHIEIFEKKISLRGSQFKEKQYSVSIIELFTLLNEKIKFSFFTRFFYELVGRSDIYFDLYRGIIITVIMVIIIAKTEILIYVFLTLMICHLIYYWWINVVIHNQNLIIMCWQCPSLIYIQYIKETIWHWEP